MTKCSRIVVIAFVVNELTLITILNFFYSLIQLWYGFILYVWLDADINDLIAM